MGSERPRRSSYVLNLTPLIDIVFLLLVFFMLTAHFVEDEGISIDLPDASNVASVEDEGVVEVVIGSDGRLLVEGEAVEPERLEQTLRGALHAPGKRLVRLRGDHESRLGLAVKVMDAARGAGAEAMDILTERP